jgi:hypothetical protein
MYFHRSTWRYIPAVACTVMYFHRSTLSYTPRQNSSCRVHWVIPQDRTPRAEYFRMLWQGLYSIDSFCWNNNYGALILNGFYFRMKHRGVFSFSLKMKWQPKGLCSRSLERTELYIGLPAPWRLLQWATEGAEVRELWNVKRMNLNGSNCSMFPRTQYIVCLQLHENLQSRKRHCCITVQSTSLCIPYAP